MRAGDLWNQNCSVEHSVQRVSCSGFIPILRCRKGPDRTALNQVLAKNSTQPAARQFANFCSSSASTQQRSGWTSPVSPRNPMGRISKVGTCKHLFRKGLRNPLRGAKYALQHIELFHNSKVGKIPGIEPLSSRHSGAVSMQFRYSLAGIVVHC